MVRVACIQYQLSEISGFDEFASKVTTQVTTAASQKADFVIFPEFFSIQLLSSLGNIPDTEGILRIAREFTTPFIALFSSLARKHGLHIIAGSHPVEEGGKVFNKSFVFDTEGNHLAQPKLHITPFERNDWEIVGGKELVVV